MADLSSIIWAMDIHKIYNLRWDIHLLKSKDFFSILLFE